MSWEKVLIDGKDFDPDSDLPKSWLEDGIFRYCNFANLNLDVGGFEETLIGCKFTNVEWYWGLFNCANLLSTRFVNCTFLGSKFADCRLIECKFEDCRFDLDNLGGPCGFRNCLLVDTSFDRCQVTLDNPHNHAVFERNRVYGCTQSGCIGFDMLLEQSA